MIKINELRVGNIVSVNNGFEMLVHSIFSNDTVYLDFIPPLINEADVWEEDFKDVCPVEITEEWLLKFGATKEQDYFIYGRFKLIYNNTYKFWNVLNREFGDGYLTKIEYVHEWQNFVFVMDGEELKLKIK